MIIDTTYLLPLAGIEVDTDLLSAAARGEALLDFGEISVSLISVFELQAKAAKLTVPAVRVIEAVKAVIESFNIVSFYEREIIERSYELKEMILDYIDCVIVATAIAVNEELVTEDSLILQQRENIKRRYGVDVLSFSQLIGSSP